MSRVAWAAKLGVSEWQVRMWESPSRPEVGTLESKSMAALDLALGTATSEIRRRYAILRANARLAANAE
jgi:hypothetical protein